MSGELVGVLAAMAIVGTLNVTILVFVFNISREIGSLGVRVDHLEKGVTDAVDTRMDQLEADLKKREAHLDNRLKKRSDEIHSLVMETRKLRALVAKTMRAPPESLDDL